jgi:hypothetical protein
MNFENLFDLDEAIKTNILISGSNHTGKTSLACGISSMLHKLGFRVRVFDTSGAWRKQSDLPQFSKAYRFDKQTLYGELEGSGIYDLSLLRSSEAKRVVERETERIWNERAIRTVNEPMWCVFEEAEAYLRNIRGNISENIYRLVHQGRNQAIRCILITTDLALLDASVIRLCQIRFHGSLGIEENAKRKFRAYYGKDWCRIATEGLELGDFIRLHKKHLEVIYVWEFKRKHAPKQAFNLIEEKQEPKPQPQKQGFFSRLFSPLSPF